jgi:hypothetical protein
MTLAEAMYAYLQTLSVGLRVYPRTLPKDAVLPAITFQIIPAVGPLKVHSDAHDGSGPPGGLYMRARMQWDAWGTDYLEAEALAREMRHALHGFKGYMGDLYIGAVHLDIDMDSYDQGIPTYRRIMDGMVQYQEVLATGS